VPSAGLGRPDSLKAGAGHPPIRGVQGLARTAEWTAPHDMTRIAIPSEQRDPTDSIFAKKGLF